MHAVNLISSAIRGLPEEPDTPSGSMKGVCCLTGETCQTLPRSKLFGKSFTAQSKFKAPNSDRVSVDAFRALQYKWERMSSWIATAHEFERIDKPEIRRVIINADYPREPWAGHITTTWKKHGALTTPVNTGAQCVWAFNELAVSAELATLRPIYNRLLSEKLAGLGNEAMETLDCPGFVINKIGLRRWMDFESWAKAQYLSTVYKLALFLLPSIEELKK